jgi:ribosomal protein S30
MILRFLATLELHNASLTYKMRGSIGVKRKRNVSPRRKNTLVYTAMHVIEKVKAGRLLTWGDIADRHIAMMLSEHNTSS